jgi:transcriptional regulator with XRE-family HTH domain
MAVVHRWTGSEAQALRFALRLSVRAFADHLGVAARTVSNWEKHGPKVEPRPDTQAILDTALARADPGVHERFEALVSHPVPRRPAEAERGPRAWEYETWSDDLDRAAAALGTQAFTSAARLLDRWLTRWPIRELDDRGHYLLARSSSLHADSLRDRGMVAGPVSARRSYRAARDVFARLGSHRRVAQTELLLTLTTEMAGELAPALRAYEHFSSDDRLCDRDRARALLWMGRTLSKLGDHENGIRLMTAASRVFDELDEPDDWSVAQQKIALAHRADGALTQALLHIEMAAAGLDAAAPLPRVRLNTARGHILLSDPATREVGLTTLADAARTAERHSLGHQVRSIRSILRTGGLSPLAPPDP